MPAKKTRAKKAQAEKKQAKEMPSPNTPPASGRSPFTRLPLEIHMVIGDMLKEEKQLGALALMWGARRGSIPVMKTAKGWGADLDTRTHLGGRYRTNGARLIVKGTALQFTIREEQNEAMQWLFKQGVLVDVPNKPARNMCQCSGGWNARDCWASTLHIAVCTGNLDAVKLLLNVRREAAAALEFSRKFDHDLILHTAVCHAFWYHRLDILDVVLENTMIRKSINDFKSEAHGGCTALAMALVGGGAYSGHCSTEQIFAALVKAGASLGPYPPGSYMAGKSPLLHQLDQGNLRTNARYLLKLGCDPNGDRPDPVTTEWEIPLHACIPPKPENIYCRLPYTPSILPQKHGSRSRDIRDFIVAVLKHGASLDITDFHGNSPLDSALSYMAPYLPPGLRILGFKFVKLLLANVTDKGISEKSRKRAEDVTATVVQDLRAEHATHYLSYDRVGPLQEQDWGVGGEEEFGEEGNDAEEPTPILLGWHTWTREGGRLSRK
ncbi:hypothetical protein QBC32DRAFT_404634 [Pseudoneurospora amorphoporcata]|uniref:Ankyrin n=1 Tax=Pseudoneurospora amorphoporcata TaxID=241081 RepID=A0AAN6SHL7_9PEZI|nr:hypothetical protein QBC32DRAFT_404634 [Pseudoneurospora amorphoporcata]